MPRFFLTSRVAARSESEQEHPKIETASASLPAPAPAKPAMVEPIAPSRWKVQFTASAELRDKLDRLRSLMRSSVPDGDIAAIIRSSKGSKRSALGGRRPRRKASKRLIRRRRHAIFRLRLNVLFVRVININALSLRTTVGDVVNETGSSFTTTSPTAVEATMTLRTFPSYVDATMDISPSATTVGK